METKDLDLYISPAENANIDLITINTIKTIKKAVTHNLKNNVVDAILWDSVIPEMVYPMKKAIISYKIHKNLSKKIFISKKPFLWYDLENYFPIIGKDFDHSISKRESLIDKTIFDLTSKLLDIYDLIRSPLIKNEMETIQEINDNILILSYANLHLKMARKLAKEINAKDKQVTIINLKKPFEKITCKINSTDLLRIVSNESFNYKFMKKLALKLLSLREIHDLFKKSFQELETPMNRWFCSFTRFIELNYKIRIPILLRDFLFGLEFFKKCNSTNKFVSFNDWNPSGRMFNILAKSRSIETHLLPHGILIPEPMYGFVRSENVNVFSKEDKDILEYRKKINNIKITGFPVKFEDKIIKEEKIIDVLLISQPWTTSNFIETIFNQLIHIAELNPLLKIMVKVHPRDNIKNYKKIIKKKRIKNFSVNQERNLFDLCKISKVCVTENSTGIFDAFYNGVPSITCDFHKKPALPQFEKYVLHVTDPKSLSTFIMKLIHDNDFYNEIKIKTENFQDLIIEEKVFYQNIADQIIK